MRFGMSFDTALERPRNPNSVKITGWESLSALSTGKCINSFS